MSSSKTHNRSRSKWTRKRKTKLNLILGVLSLVAVAFVGCLIAFEAINSASYSTEDVADPTDNTESATKVTAAKDKPEEASALSLLEQVIYAHQKATNIDQLVSLKVSARLETHLSNGPAEQHRLTFYFRRPNLVRRIMEMDGKKIDMGYNGTDVWSYQYAPDGSSRQVDPVPSIQAEVFRRGARIGSYLWEFEKDPDAFSLAQQATVGDRPCFVVNYENDNLRIVSYIDQETSLELAREEFHQTDAGLREQRLTFSDHRMVNGVTMPYSIDSSAEGFSSHVSFEDVDINGGVPSYIFDAPLERYAGAKPGISLTP